MRRRERAPAHREHERERRGDVRVAEARAAKAHRTTIRTRDGLCVDRHVAGLRCDGFPETALVAVHRTLDQACYGKLPGDRRTSKITIAPSDTAEPYLEVVKQK